MVPAIEDWKKNFGGWTVHVSGNRSVKLKKERYRK